MYCSNFKLKEKITAQYLINSFNLKEKNWEKIANVSVYFGQNFGQGQS